MISLRQAQVQFAAEFVTLVVTASALALLLLRPPPRRFDVAEADVRRRPTSAIAQAVLSGIALAALGGAAFLHGSLLVQGQRVEWVGLARVAAAALLLLAFPYPGGPRTGRTPVGGYLLRLGFPSWLVAGGVEVGSGGSAGPDVAYLIDALLIAGSVLIAGALLRVGRRSIAVRVAASGASTLLLVVVVLALALSAVISSKVQPVELGRLSALSSAEQSSLADTTAVSTDAQDVETYLAAKFGQTTGAPPAYSEIVQALRPPSLPPRVDGAKLGFTLWDDTPAPLRPGSCSSGHKGVFQSAGSILLAASSPFCTNAGDHLGVVIATRELNDTYLAGQERANPNVGLALVSGGTVYAAAGITPTEARAAASLSSGDQAVTKAVGSRFVSAANIPAAGTNGRPLTLVLSEVSNSADSVVTARNQLFRTLFLIAFGGTLLALGLAIFTGDRITAGLRRLTRAAAGIAAGDASLRAGVGGDDEVASLGSAFDAMLDSVSAQAAALQTAAEDEARLRNRLQAVVAGMSDALIAVDSFGHITDFNQAAVDLTGVAATRALGANATDVVRLNNEEGVPVARQLLQVGSRSTALMARVVRGDTEIPVAVSSGALRGPSGELVGTVLVFRDMRREQEVEQMKTEFLSRIGHELRTPLTGILGYADILLRRPVPEERARAWYEDILQSARRLLRIVEMLEFFASEGAGRAVLRPEPVDVRGLVNGIASSWTGRLPPNLTIGRRLPKAETVVTADQRWLTLAVDELIDNAVKFSPEGGRILIKVDSGPEMVEISVSDQGMGMTAQHYDVIFGDFVQGDNSDTRRFGGLGLGLAVVRRVVEGHGGKISCRSAPGRGTTFVIGLPVWPAERGVEPVPPDAAAAEPAQEPRRLRRPLRAARPSPTERGKGP